MKRITVALCALVLMSLLLSPVCAFAESDSTIIAVTVPSTHTITISSDNAEVTYNGEVVTETEVPRLSEFVLNIEVDDGYTVERVELNGEDVTACYSDGVLTLDGVNADGTLAVITTEVSTDTDTDTATDTDSDADAASTASVSSETSDTASSATSTTAATTTTAASSTVSSVGKSSFKTGDARNVLLFVVILTAAGATAVYAHSKRGSKPSK